MNNDLNPQNQAEQIKKYRYVLKWIFLIIFIIVVIIIYKYSKNSKPTITQNLPTRPTAEINREPESTTAYTQVEILNTLSNSDELSAIEADLESTNLDFLLQEINAIETELN